MNTASAQGNALSDAVVWLQGTLLGSIASTIAILATAIVGLLMLNGRVPLRRGASIVIGCFILFSADTIVEGLLGSIDRPPAEIGLTPPAPAYTAETPRAVSDDPYAGAAVPAQR